MIKLSWLVTCFFTITAVAQENLIILGTSSDRYVLHRTNGRENLQTISNVFGISVARLSSYNKLNASAPLYSGVTIKIPVSLANIVRQKNDNNAAVYHKVHQGDNLYRLSKEYKLPLSLLREWNGLNSDILKNGQLVKVGFMVNAPSRSYPANSTNGRANKSPEIFPSMRVSAPVVIVEKPKEIKVLNTPSNTNVYEIEKPIKQKEEEKKEQKSVSAPVTDLKIVAETPKIVAEPQKTVKPVLKKQEEFYGYIPMEGDEGFFATTYAEHSGNQVQQFRSGDAATFKTISGWSDRKFYVLMDDVAPKTIIRITGSGNRSICAMVLGPMQEIRGGAGLLLRISNSAAVALGFTETKFTVTISYFE